MLHKNVKDLTGLRFGRLVVIGLSHKVTVTNPNQRGGSKLYWKCQCDCGNEKVVAGNHLKDKNTQSCGCLKDELKKVCKSPKGQTGFHQLFNNYKTRAKSKDLSFELTKEDFKNLNKGNCFYCGNAPILVSKAFSKTNPELVKHSEYTYNGIDRIDSSKGYTTTNTVSCCEICNKAKRDLPVEEFLDWVDDVNRHQKFQLMDELYAHCSPT